MIDCIVPALNEQQTIGGVLDRLKASGAFRRILVVDDGSKDRTADIARRAGAAVLRLTPNRGKGQAMLAAARRTTAPRVAFFDADLRGLSESHVRRLVEASNAGYDMVCGLRDYGLFGNPLQGIGPLITGERIMKRWVLERCPPSCFRGYAIETALNDTVRRHGGRTCLVPMIGCGVRGKVKKAGILDGLGGHWKMFRQIWDTQCALRRSGGTTCTLGGG
jgi:glycosyltransferase involved in cell wall biosynthesis